MIQIRLHGRGGQGAWSATELIARAAFQEGNMVQAFPAFGSEKMGTPVQGFVKIDTKKIPTRTYIHQPHYVIVLDPTLCNTIDVLSGIQENGVVLVNFSKQADKLTFMNKPDTAFDIVTFPATKVANDILGKPIPNAVMAGIFAEVTGVIKVESVKQAILTRWPGSIGEKNVRAVEEGCRMRKEGTSQ
jgi:pyruvate ferredoxin oxidoreductase gamma subunit